MQKNSLAGLCRWVGALALFAAASFPTAQAASIPISRLLVDNASLNVTLTEGGTGTYHFSTPIVPPANLIMGSYQNPIARFSTVVPSGTATAVIYSAGDGTNPPPPSGYVDGAAINVDFSSLRATLDLPDYPTLDIPLWPLINPPSGGTYHSATGAYTLSWMDNFSVMVGSGPTARRVSGMADVTLAGQVALVPLPGALWLLGSGLLGLVTLMRRKQSTLSAG